MTVIWGFDLSEMHWDAFGSKNMFDGRWYLRKERISIPHNRQCCSKTNVNLVLVHDDKMAMLVGLAAECTATYSLSKYNFHQSHIEEATNFTATELNNDLINSAISTICFCVFVATLFGADFFFLVFWPRRRYPAWYRHTKLGLAVGITLGMFGSAIASTVVITSQSARIVGVDSARAQELVNVFFRPPLMYRSWPQNIAWIVLLWIATIFTLGSTILMFKAASHDEKYGTDARADEQVLSPSPVRKSRSRIAGNDEVSVMYEGRKEKDFQGSSERAKDRNSLV